MLKLQADYIFSIVSEPIENGILIADDSGKIVDVINPLNLDYSLENFNKIEGVLCPGFVNTHCHLELSYMQNKVRAGLGLDNFISSIVQEKKRRDVSIEYIQEEIRLADEQMYKNGIVAVADISNTLLTADLKTKSKIYYHTFVELYALDPAFSQTSFENGIDVYNVFSKKMHGQVSLTAHSFYGVSVELLKDISKFAEGRSSLFSIHHLESAEEIKFFHDKSGNITARLVQLGIDISSFMAIGKRPLSSRIDLLPMKNKILFVHNTYADICDVKVAINNLTDVYWCFCPNSNLFIENSLPDFELFRKTKQINTIGTDSKASNSQLSVFEEIKTIQKHCNIPTSELLKWSCLNGATFLGIDGIYGSFEKGKKPGVLCITNVDVQNNFTLKNTSKVKRCL